jgi:hypothetical protein
MPKADESFDLAVLRAGSSAGVMDIALRWADADFLHG